MVNDGLEDLFSLIARQYRHILVCRGHRLVTRGVVTLVNLAAHALMRSFLTTEGGQGPDSEGASKTPEAI